MIERNPLADLRDVRYADLEATEQQHGRFYQWLMRHNLGVYGRTVYAPYSPIASKQGTVHGIFVTWDDPHIDDYLDISCDFALTDLRTGAARDVTVGDIVDHVTMYMLPALVHVDNAREYPILAMSSVELDTPYLLVESNLREHLDTFLAEHGLEMYSDLIDETPWLTAIDDDFGALTVRFGIMVEDQKNGFSLTVRQIVALVPHMRSIASAYYAGLLGRPSTATGGMRQQNAWWVGIEDRLSAPSD